MGLRDVQESVEWIPSGSPWLDKGAQVSGDQLAISIGLDNAIDAARRRGGDVFANIDKTAQVMAYAKEKGVPMPMGAPGARTVEEIVQQEVAAAKENESGK